MRPWQYSSESSNTRRSISILAVPSPLCGAGAPQLVERPGRAVVAWRMLGVHPVDDRHELLALGDRHREVHLEDSNPGFRGMDVHVGIDEARQQLHVERVEKPLQRRGDGHLTAGPARDPRPPEVPLPRAAPEKQGPY